MRALVTGHLGFIGRWMARALDAAGYEVHGIDLAEGDDAREFFTHDERAFYDVVVHAAAVEPHRAAIDGSPLVVAGNLELDAAMFGWAAKAKPGRVVYLSSSAAYPVALQHGDADSFPVGRLGTHLDPRRLREDDIGLGSPRQPDAIYGWVKLTGELLAQYAREAGVTVSVVRPFSGYAEDQSGMFPFGAFRDRVLARADPFAIWGSGEQVRDFIHAEDVCAAILTMIGEGIDGPVNLGTGRPTTMTGLAGMFCGQAGYQPTMEAHPEQPAGVAYRVADTTRLRGFFTPKVSLEEGVHRALATT